MTMDAVECFLIERTAWCRRFLFRHVRAPDARGSGCERGWHEGAALLDRVEATDADAVSVEGNWPKDDPRWPKQCERCSYEFKEDDARVLYYEREWVRPGTSAIFTLREPTGRSMDADAAPVGAMWDAHWFHGVTRWRGEDGKSLTLRTPGGDWLIDGPVSRDSERRWRRWGAIPKVSVAGIFARRQRPRPWRDFDGVLRDGLLHELVIPSM